MAAGRSSAYGAVLDPYLQLAKKRQSRVDGQVCPSTLLVMVRPPAGSPYETSTNRQGTAGWRRAAFVTSPQVEAGHHPTAIGAGFVRLATGRARIRPAGARGRRAGVWPGRGRRTKKRDSCSKNAVWEWARGLGLRGSLDGEPVSWGNARASHSGGRLRGARPPPAGAGAPHLRPRSQFLNANGKIWVQPRPLPGVGAGRLRRRDPRLEAARVRQIPPIGRPETGSRPPWSKPAFAVGTENAGFDHASGRVPMIRGFVGKPKRPGGRRGVFPGQTVRFASSERRF